METNNFICSCLGIDGDVVDELCDEFNLDFDDDEIFDIIDSNTGDLHNCGSALLMCLYGKIIGNYSDVLDEELFDFDVSSPSFPDFYYDGERIECKDQLDEIYEQLELKKNE